MGRAKLTDAQAAASYLRRLEATRQRRLAARNEPPHAQQAHEITFDASIAIARSEGTENATDTITDNAASAAAAELSTAGVAAINETASRSGNHDLRSRTSPMPLISIRSGIRSPRQDVNSGHPGASSQDGPLDDARETSPGGGAGDIAQEEDALTETFGFEALTVLDDDENVTAGAAIWVAGDEIVPCAEKGAGFPNEPLDGNASGLWDSVLEANEVAWDDGLFLTLNETTSEGTELKSEEDAEVKSEDFEVDEPITRLPELEPSDTHSAESDTTELESSWLSCDITFELDDEAAQAEMGAIETTAQLRTSIATDRSVSALTTDEFFRQQADTYRTIMQDAFSITCSCRRQGNDQQPTEQAQQHGELFSMRQMSSWIQAEIGDSEAVLEPFQAKDCGDGGGTRVRQWQKALSQPPAALSLERSEGELPRQDISIERFYDIDSIRLGLRTLGALPDDNDSFLLSFLPPYLKTLSGNQVLQPHGVDLGHTRHILLGSFSIGNMSMDTFLFFPNTNDGRRFQSAKQATTAERAAGEARFTLSYERQKELVDLAILPALRASVPSIHRQELPPNFDIAAAKAQSGRERSGRNHRANDDHIFGNIHTKYTIPGRYIEAFWKELEARCNRIRVSTSPDEDHFAYFARPKLFAQTHDTKNLFAMTKLQEVLDTFRRRVLENLNVNQVDLASSSVDIGFRDMPCGYRDQNGCERQVTLLWKKPCLEHFQSRIQTTSPEMRLKHEYFSSYGLRDAAGYSSKSTGTSRQPRSSDPGNPNCRKLGVYHAKAYSCGKERFSVLSDKRRPFDEPNLASMALKDVMLKELFAAGYSPCSAVPGAPIRSHLESAWDASKHRLGTVSRHTAPTNGYAARKEITFRLDIILWMLEHGYFGSHGGTASTLGEAAKFTVRDTANHLPYWVLDTAEANRFVCVLNTHFIPALEHIFHLGRANEAQIGPAGSARSVAWYYTAQLLLRLLMCSLGHDRRWPTDRWIWESKWTARGAKNGRKGKFVRHGLGLQALVNKHGCVWLETAQVDWLHFHLSLEKLLQLYIARNPLHPTWAGQSNVQGYTRSVVSTSYVVEGLLIEAARLREAGGASTTRAVEIERTAAKVATQEIARTYMKHLLSKLQWYWTNAYKDNADMRRSRLKGPPSLKAATADVYKPVATMATAQTVLVIYSEAWRIHCELGGGDVHAAAELPPNLPYWMAKRSPKEQSWTLVVYNMLFGCSNEARWASNTFVTMYKQLKGLYDMSRHPDADDFDQMFKWRIGRYITVMFNSDQTKEVNTSHAAKDDPHNIPSFFRIQFWAPLINPFRYVQEKATITRPSYPLSDLDRRYHQALQLRNLYLREGFFRYGKSPIRTGWVLQQPPDAIRQLACDVSDLVESLLLLTAPIQYKGIRQLAPIRWWDYEDPSSPDHALWEVPVENATLYARPSTIPTTILPTESSIDFILKIGRSVRAVFALLQGQPYDEAIRQVKRLRARTHVMEQLLQIDAFRNGLLSLKMGALEEARQRYEQDDSADLLVQFIKQATIPQE